MSDQVEVQKPGKPSRIIGFLLAGAIAGGVILAVRGSIGAPADQYQYKAPPPGPNAKPDPPNPDKIKRLPTMATPPPAKGKT